jgi:hypothetical protein
VAFAPGVATLNAQNSCLNMPGLAQPMHVMCRCCAARLLPTHHKLTYDLICLLQINRCVRCNPLGTYSLNPIVQCQSCPAGGTCLKGLLVPSEGFFSYSPFVPQILRCPLQGGCLGNSNSNPVDVQGLMQVSEGAGGKVTHGSSSSRRQLLRRLLQAVAAGQTANGSSSSSSSEEAQAHAPVQLTPRNAALFQYLSLLSDKWTADRTDGVPVLADLSYAQLLVGWRDLQCSPG